MHIMPYPHLPLLGFCSLVIDEEASLPIGKSEFLNNILDTKFECDRSTYFKFVTVDIDCGLEFNPALHISVADVHGHLEDHFVAITGFFSIILAHVSAKDWHQETSRVYKDLKMFRERLRVNKNTKLFLLIQDADHCGLSQKFLDDTDELYLNFILLQKVFTGSISS